MKPKKIISGSFYYVRRAVQSWTTLGYKVIKTKKWSDGKYTIVLEKSDDL